MGTAVLNMKSVSALRNTLSVYIWERTQCLPVAYGESVSLLPVIQLPQVLSQGTSGCYFTLAPTAGRAWE